MTLFTLAIACLSVGFEGVSRHHPAAGGSRQGARPVDFETPFRNRRRAWTGVHARGALACSISARLRLAARWPA
jgi:hypothetical protein